LDFLTPLGPGDRIGPYTIVRVVSEGGMGVVFEARHDELERPTAVKVLSPWLATEIGRARFEREIEACAGLAHPNTIEIYDYGERPDGTLYYAMELLEGYDLGRIVDLDGPLHPARVVRVLRQIAGALGEAHGEGLVHRDIKPANIVLCEAGGVPDVAKLVDFGLVTHVVPRSARRLTLDGSVIGTPRYVAPELLRAGGTLTPAADLYGLGLVAYFLLCGRHAFEGDSSAVILGKQRNEPPPPLERRAPRIPRDLASVVHWCLAKSPAERPTDARALLEALGHCADANLWDADLATAWWDEWRARPGAATSRPPSGGAGRSDPDGRAQPS